MIHSSYRITTIGSTGIIIIRVSCINCNSKRFGRACACRSGGNEITECKRCFNQNIEKGITEGLYRKETNISASVLFYYSLMFSINENTASEKVAQELELDALEYHTRAIATQKGILELEKQLQNKQ